MANPDGVVNQDSVLRQERRPGWVQRLRSGLTRSRDRLGDRLDAALSGRQSVDEEVLEAIEEALISSDVGVETSLTLVERLRRDPLPGQGVDVLALRARLVQEIALLLHDLPQVDPDCLPRVDLLVGVNGAGKTTTLAKFAQRAKNQGEKVLLVAGDTFRAAAIEQVQIWGERLEIPVLARERGADAAAVVYQGLEVASHRGCDRVIVDTAGRLHNRTPLMEELAKVRRVVENQASDRVLTTWLVLDATTGQNALVQAREFQQLVQAQGLILAKMDGTAKGGMAIAVAHQLQVAVGFLGVGETAEDLVPFNPRQFAEQFLGYDLERSVESISVAEVL